MLWLSCHDRTWWSSVVCWCWATCGSWSCQQLDSGSHSWECVNNSRSPETKNQAPFIQGKLNSISFLFCVCVFVPRPAAIARRLKFHSTCAFSNIATSSCCVFIHVPEDLAELEFSANWEHLLCKHNCSKQLQYLVSEETVAAYRLSSEIQKFGFESFDKG